MGQRKVGGGVSAEFPNVAIAGHVAGKPFPPDQVSHVEGSV